jgi:hypothetical protein
MASIRRGLVGVGAVGLMLLSAQAKAFNISTQANTPDNPEHWGELGVYVQLEYPLPVDPAAANTDVDKL